MGKLSFYIILLLSFINSLTFVYGLSYNVEWEQNCTIISGSAGPFEEVGIVISKPTKRYYIDIITADANGYYEFVMMLSPEELFDAALSVGDEVIEFIIFTPEIDIETDEDNNTNNNSNSNSSSSSNNSIRVSVSIDMLTINKGFVVPKTYYEVNSGATVWEVTQYILDDYNIDYNINFSGQYGSVYVESIDGIGEFDYGVGSGWLYSVNESFPDYGSSLYSLKSGDNIAWRYSTNFGEDLGEIIDDETVEDLLEDTNSVESLTTEEILAQLLETDLTFEEILDQLTEEQLLEIAKELLQNAFIDYDDISEWALIDIMRAYELGIIGGYADGTLLPRKAVTRAEFLSILTRALYGNDIEETKVQVVFSDVQETNWFYNVVNFAYEKGLAVGYGEEFRPNNLITRQEMAVMLKRALNLDTKTPEILPEDIKDIATWAVEDVLTTYAHGLIVGIEDNFEPHTITDRQVATIVALRAYDYLANQNME